MLGVRQADLHVLRPEGSARRKTTKCFGEGIYLLVTNIWLLFHRMKLDFLW